MKWQLISIQTKQDNKFKKVYLHIDGVRLTVSVGKYTQITFNLNFVIFLES